MKLRPLIHAKRGTSSTHKAELPEKVLEVIQQAYTKPFSIQSDFARRTAFYVAAAASLGYITTRTSPRQCLYGPLWRPTKAGLHFLEKDQ